MEQHNTVMYNYIEFQSNGACFKKETSDFIIEFPKQNIKFELFSIQKNDCKLVATLEKDEHSREYLEPQFIRIKDMSTNRTVLKDFVVYENLSHGVDLAFHVFNHIIDEMLTIREGVKNCIISYSIQYSNLIWKYHAAEKKIMFYNAHNHCKVFNVPLTYTIEDKEIDPNHMEISIKHMSNNRLVLHIEVDISRISNLKFCSPITLHRQLIIE